MAVSEATVETTPQQSRHDWIHIAVGRICQKCHLVQSNDEFDDAAPCLDLPDGRRRRRRPLPDDG
jgi:hypothetical protein